MLNDFCLLSGDTHKAMIGTTVNVLSLAQCCNQFVMIITILTGP